MIPLSQWLSGLEDDGRLRETPADAKAFDDGEQVCPVSLIDEAYARGRRDQRAEMLTNSETLQDEHRNALALQEAELNVTWECRVSTDLASSVAAAFQGVRQRLEVSIHEVLRPFLDEAVVKAASAQLISQICMEVARSSSPIIEIRSPATLHARLEELLSEKGIAVSLSERDVIEVTARDGTSRFESMAARWIALLHGGEA